MKKYLFGLFAVALAIGFSAFTTANKEKKINTQPSLFWYVAESDGDIGSLVFGALPQNKKTKETAIADFAECDDNGEPLCLVGDDDNNLEGLPISGNIDADQDFRIKESIQP